MMRKFLSLIAIAFLITSCTESVTFNDPGVQGLKDDYLWKANDARAYVTNGRLTIEAYATSEILTLGTASTNLGKYTLGTTNSNNIAAYVSNFYDEEIAYATIPSPGPVSNVSVNNGGTGYTSTSSSVTGGSGTGMSVIPVVNNVGQVTAVTVISRGNGYVAGDLVNVVGGNQNCTLRVVNGQNSNGEIEITEFDDINMTVSGKFKFNAVKSNNSSLGKEVINYQYGQFYNIKIYPSI